MLEDRPVMRLHLLRDDEMWTWAVRGFAGCDLGFLVYWERASPPSGAEANHTFPRPGQVALVRIRPLPEPHAQAFESAWSCFVFEIENLRSAAEYLSVHEDAVSGRLDRDEWVRRNTLLEFSAIERTRQFYARLWAPWCAGRGLSPTPRKWYVGGAATYEAWMETQSGLHLRSFWANAFDRKFARLKRPGGCSGTPGRR
jgi:hypothetical protein